jgi:hypothetical protein
MKKGLPPIRGFAVRYGSSSVVVCLRGTDCWALCTPSGNGRMDGMGWDGMEDRIVE